MKKITLFLFASLLSLLVASNPIPKPLINTEKMEKAVANAAFGNPNLISFTPQYEPNGSYLSLVATLEFDSQWNDPTTGLPPCENLSVQITYSYQDGHFFFNNEHATFTVSYGGNLPGTNEPWYTGYITDFIPSLARVTSISVTSVTAE